MIDQLRSGPPAPKAMLMPDSRFFVRTVEVTEAMDAQAVATQAELSLESISPFPVTQLYHGFYWVPGSSTALIFASYRRRIAADVTEQWPGLDWVAPSFCAVLGYQAKPGTTLVYEKDDCFTAVHWTGGKVPSQVLVRPIPPEAEGEAKQALQDSMVRELGGTQTHVVLDAAPVAVRSQSESLYRFKAGSTEFEIPVEIAERLDIRPVEILTSLRKAKQRDLILWRSSIGVAALLLLLGLGEGLLGLGSLLQKKHLQQVTAQRSKVEVIMNNDLLTRRIEELSTKRLLPFEMLDVISSKKPTSIWFTKVTTTDLYDITVEATTQDSASLASFETALNALNLFNSVQLKVTDSRGATTKFRLQASFKPGAVKAAQ